MLNGREKFLGHSTELQRNAYLTRCLLWVAEPFFNYCTLCRPIYLYDDRTFLYRGCRHDLRVAV